MATLLNIDIPGTQEHAEAMNAKLKADLAIAKTRPFLNGQEKSEFTAYFGDWARNNFISLLSFDKSGNFLPEAYTAPNDIMKLLYPINEIISYDRSGTIVIDREQYNPALHKLSFFVYIVDEDLYNEYYEKQHFNVERGKRPYMHNLQEHDGIRVFKNYFELARHLRKNRLVTYVLGPRTLFYLRFYMHQIQLHTVEDDYAFGKKVDSSLIHEVVSTIQTTLAFGREQTQVYNAKVTEDDYTLFRILTKKYNMYLPEIRKFSNKTEIRILSKQRLTCNPFVVKKNKQRQYDNLFGVKPWHSCYHVDKYYLFFVWDTRKVEIVLDETQVNENDLTLAKFDNRFDLQVKQGSTPDDIVQICKQLSNNFAIQIRQAL